MNIQQRFEESSIGQTFLSVLFVALIVGVLAWNAPVSRLSNAISDKARPAIWGLGLDQDWEVFAPNPQDSSVDLRADVTLADGQLVSWRPPRAGRFVQPYRTYRWWKWIDHIRVDANSAYWYQFATWVANKYRDSSPVSVTLVRLWRNTTVPGTSLVDHWHSYAFYTLQLPGATA